MGFIAPPSLPAGVRIRLGLFFSHFFHAVVTNIFAPKLNDTVRIAAEYAGAGRFILAKNDFITVHVNFQCIFFIDTQSAAKLNGNNDTPQLINLANNSCSFYFFGSLLSNV